jgi:hypothetical protein
MKDVLEGDSVILVLKRNLVSSYMGSSIDS